MKKKSFIFWEKSNFIGDSEPAASSELTFFLFLDFVNLESLYLFHKSLSVVMMSWIALLSLASSWVQIGVRISVVRLICLKYKLKLLIDRKN